MDATEPATHEERAAIVQALDACPGEGPDVDLFGLLGLMPATAPVSERRGLLGLGALD
jgi:hypothetical protein